MTRSPSWHKILLAFLTAFLTACLAANTMFAGHGQLGDEQFAKRLRRHLVDSKTAQAESLDEQASHLHSEVNNISSMVDEGIATEYGVAFSGLEAEESPLYATNIPGYGDTLVEPDT